MQRLREAGADTSLIAVLVNLINITADNQKYCEERSKSIRNYCKDMNFEVALIDALRDNNGVETYFQKLLSNRLKNKNKINML